MAADLGAIKKLIEPRKRHVNINLEAAKEIKQLPIDGDSKQRLDETHDKRDQLQQHLSMNQNLREQLENVAKTASKKMWCRITRNTPMLC